VIEFFYLLVCMHCIVCTSAFATWRLEVSESRKVKYFRLNLGK
jgi:hypothetical protein